jgi:hypothetical protein
MGVYGNNSCKKNSIIYTVIYFFMIILLITIGGLYESEIIERNNEYTEKSVWWYGAIGVLGTFILLILLNLLFYYFKGISSSTKTSIWYLSHILCYFVLTFVSPGQWPFWLAIGILWEWFECYGPCMKNLPITCSGSYDITANLAGTAIAMWIRSEIPVKSLLK